jgi:hypothetical protein
MGRRLSAPPPPSFATTEVNAHRMSASKYWCAWTYHLREYLQGKMSFVEMINPAKAKRLQSIFEQISWG